MILFWALVGLAVGSFLNVVIDRLPNDESIAWPPSHCGACGRRLAALEMIPVISFVALRGRCRTCGASIGARVLGVELLTGLLFAAAAWQMPPNSSLSVPSWPELGRLVLTSAYLAVFVSVTFTDLEHGLILDNVIYLAVALALLGVLVTGPQDWLSHVLGGVIGAGTITLIILLVPEGMGWGDAKLAGFIGLVTGWPGIGFALFLAFVSGGIVAGILLATGRKRRGQTIALGPFLAAAGAFILLVGSDAALRAFYSLARLF